MDICVIGGGPAGMMASISAAMNGARVTLLEKNEKLGKKLFLTGKGRCNVTNSCLTEELFDNIVRNSKFMYSSIYGFDNGNVIDFFEKNGLQLKEERGKRIFPLSDHSSDVIKTLKNCMDKHNVNCMLNTEVVDIQISDSSDGSRPKIESVILKGGRSIKADAVILATGGKSYPSTGSDGCFFELIKDKGIEVKECCESLVPLVTDDSLITELQGLSLKNVSLEMFINDKRKYSGFGEMLFTHFGVSGPLVLTASTYLNKDDYKKRIRLEIDMKPALNKDELNNRILRDFNDNPNKSIENVLGKLVPGKMVYAVLKRSDITASKKVNMITHEERMRLIETVKKFYVTVNGNRGFNEAIITRGGVSVKEINPSTMESKKIKGLYFAGEMIDVDAFTGGFNLQIAWSTGHLAGEAAAVN